MSSENFTAFWLGYVPSGDGTGLGPPLADAPDYIDTVALAFSNLFPGNTTCNGFLQKSNSEDSIRAGIASLRKTNPTTKIILSIQGTPQPKVGWNDGITDPAAFGSWLAYVAEDWGLDGFDVDNEDNSSFPGDAFVAAVKGMRAAMPDKLITMDTYLFYNDQTVIKELADDLDYINTMDYFDDFDGMTSLFEQYATVIAPEKINIGVKSDKVGPITQGTSLEQTKRIAAWEPKGGRKHGVMLWNLSGDIESVTGEPNGSWTRAIHETLP